MIRFEEKRTYSTKTGIVRVVIPVLCIICDITINYRNTIIYSQNVQNRASKIREHKNI